METNKIKVGTKIIRLGTRVRGKRTGLLGVVEKIRIEKPFNDLYFTVKYLEGEWENHTFENSGTEFMNYYDIIISNKVKKL